MSYKNKKVLAFISILIVSIFLFILMNNLLGRQENINSDVWRRGSCLQKLELGDLGAMEIQYVSSDSEYLAVMANVKRGSDLEPILLSNTKVFVYDKKCNKILEVENNDLSPANSIDELILRYGVLEVFYHVNPSTSMLRVFDLSSKEEEKYIVRYENQNGKHVTTRENL